MAILKLTYPRTETEPQEETKHTYIKQPTFYIRHTWFSGGNFWLRIGPLGDIFSGIISQIGRRANSRGP